MTDQSQATSVKIVPILSINQTLADLQYAVKML